jgi:hypothetical protein
MRVHGNFLQSCEFFKKCKKLTNFCKIFSVSKILEKNFEFGDLDHRNFRPENRQFWRILPKSRDWDGVLLELSKIEIRIFKPKPDYLKNREHWQKIQIFY